MAGAAREEKKKGRSQTFHCVNFLHFLCYFWAMKMDSYPENQMMKTSCRKIAHKIFFISTTILKGQLTSFYKHLDIYHFRYTKYEAGVKEHFPGLTLGSL